MVENTTKMLLLVLIVWIWLPTGPADLVIVPIIIGVVGLNTYILLSFIFTWWLYKSIKGDTFHAKFRNAAKEVGTLLKKVL